MRHLAPAANLIRSFKARHFAAIFVIGVFSVISSCGGGGGGGSGASTTISPPSNVTVARGSTKDTVSWTAAAGAVKYKVYAVKPASSARSQAPYGVSANENADCACSWQSMTCASDVASGSTCNYCETTNTCADFDHAPADINEYYQVTGIDQTGTESARSDYATDDSGSSSGGSTTSSSGGSSTSSGGSSTSSGGSALPPGMTLSCVGVEHGSGVSYIHVCVDLTNVPGENWSDFTARMGSTQSEGYSYTYNSDLQTYLTKVCSTFTIHQYGTYSGVAGITTNGGSAALTWDINVTSAAVACP